MGDLTFSEQALSAQLLNVGCWAKWIFVGDRNFGVYSVIRSITAAHAQALVRLTEVRAGKLAKQVGLKLRHGLDVAITWTPSCHDKCPLGLDPLPVAGRLLVIRVQMPGFRPQLLFLFTTLTDQSLYTPLQLSQLYAERWQIIIGHSLFDIGYSPEEEPQNIGKRISNIEQGMSNNEVGISCAPLS